MEAMLLEIQETLKECKEILITVSEFHKELEKVGSFYYSAIELDNHVKNGIDGEELEKLHKKILSLLKGNK